MAKATPAPSPDLRAKRHSLEKALEVAERHVLQGTEPCVPTSVRAACDAMFASATQAFREVALGCLLVRMHCPGTNLRLPYRKQGPHAFSGRTIDEKIVNPFLSDRSIPCSKGPYLSVFRRQVRFDDATKEGLRDPTGYEGLLRLLEAAEREEDQGRQRLLLQYLLYRFLLLREAAQVDLMRLERISLSQYRRVVEGLVSRQSGGFLAFAVVLATVRAIQKTLNLDWAIEHQGINVADLARGVGGDITIRRGEEVVLVIEVTERPVDTSRLATTFRTKIAPGHADYLFVVHLDQVNREALAQAQRYFAQGYEVDFVDLRQWSSDILATLGSRGRKCFQAEMLGLLSAPEVPGAVRVMWNEELQKVL